MNSIGSTYPKLSEQCYDFHADVGRVFCLVFPVLKFGDPRNLGPKNPGSFWVYFFPNACHRHQRHLCGLDQVVISSFAHRDAMAGCNMFFS